MLFLVVRMVVSVDKDANDATVRLIRDVVRESNVQTRTEWEDTIINTMVFFHILFGVVPRISFDRFVSTWKTKRFRRTKDFE
jgi:hypothetical protein